MNLAALCLIDTLTPVISIGAVIYLARKVHHMSQASDRVAASTAALSQSVDNAVSKLSSIPADDTAQLNAVADVLDAAKAKLDTAVSGNIATATAPATQSASTPST